MPRDFLLEKMPRLMERFLNSLRTVHKMLSKDIENLLVCNSRSVALVVVVVTINYHCSYRCRCRSLYLSGDVLVF